jgi:HK97 family phage portal protein
VKSPLGSLLRPRNNGGKPPVPLGGSGRYMRGLSFNLGNGRQDAETFMRQYGLSGTIYGIISLLAESAATPTWRLYRKQPVDGRRRYSTADTGSDQRIEVVQHAAIQLWNNPNDWHSGFEFREGAQQHEELTGETFWVLDTEAGFPTSMWYVRPDRMEPVPDPDDYLVGWIYRGPGGEQVPLRADEVILEKRPDPLDPYRGAGPVASILPNIQQQRYATEYQRNLFLNGADPGGVITVPNQLSEPEFDELIDRWREGHRGVARAGHVGVLEGGATWTPGSHSNKDLEYGALRLANRDELREAWRIHKTMMGTADDVNRANAQTAQEVFVAWQVMPRLNRRRDTLNSKLLPLFARADKTVEFDYDDPSPVNAETAANELLQKAQAAQALLAVNLFDPHDVLEVVGLPDMDTVDLPAITTPTPATLPPAAGQPGDHTRPVIHMTRPRAATTTLDTVDQQWRTATARTVTDYQQQITPTQRQQAVDQIRTAVNTGAITALGALSIDSTAAAALILAAMTAYASTSARQAQQEAQQQGATTQPVPPGRTVLGPIAAATAALLAAELATSAGREALRIHTPGMSGQQVADQVAAFLGTLSDSSLTAHLGGVLSAAQNKARLATFTAGPRTELLASEENDRNTCDPCSLIDGHSFGYSDDPAAVASAEAAYPAGGYTACEGRQRCRGTLISRYEPAKTGNQAWGAGIRAASDAGAKVFQQTAEDYPPAAMAWMHHATWTGPVSVPLEHIDWTPDEMEGRSPQHVARFVQKLRAGKKLKPVLMVKTPSGDKLQLVDGHHRYLASAELGRPVRAFVGTVDAEHGPWETMHAQQYPGNGRGDTPQDLARSPITHKHITLPAPGPLPTLAEPDFGPLADLLRHSLNGHSRGART